MDAAHALQRLHLTHRQEDGPISRGGGGAHLQRRTGGRRKYIDRGTKKKKNIQNVNKFRTRSKITCTQKASYTHTFLSKTSPMVDIGSEELSLVFPLSDRLK